MDDILKRPDVLAMLDQHDDVLPILLRPEQFRSEPLVILHNVVAQFVEILLAVDQQFRIVKTHVVCLWKL